MRTIGIIPARHASSRLPGKPLLDIGGKSMIQRVVEQAKGSASLQRVVVATDDDRILEHVRSFGGEAVMTATTHHSGTDRCAEAVEKVGGDFDAVMNIQGDEPFIDPMQIDELCRALAVSEGGIATLAQVVADERDLDDAGEVKITTDVRMNALYFSRAAIPFLHGAGNDRTARYRFLKHVGLYAFKVDVLEQLVRLPPSPLEKAESLEQLRWLENGFKVRVGITTYPSFCVDTPADLEEARRSVT